MVSKNGREHSGRENAYEVEWKRERV